MVLNDKVKELSKRLCEEENDQRDLCEIMLEIAKLQLDILVIDKCNCGYESVRPDCPFHGWRRHLWKR